MTIKTETRTVEITLKQWNEENACWSCDMFDDLETSFASAHQHAAGDNAFVASDDELNDLVSWWEDEVNASNTNGSGEILDSTDGDYSLDVTEELA